MTHRRTLAVAALVLLTTACTGRDDPAPAPATVTVAPAVALPDVPVEVTVRGLPAGARTTVTATATDAAGIRWSAAADFDASPAGVVSLGRRPAAGAYTDADPMGLFQAMTPADPSAGRFRPPTTGGYDVTLTATVDGTEVGRGVARRRTPAGAGVTATELRVDRDGVHGTAYRPADTAVRRSAVLLFGGSEGGLDPIVTESAALLAAHGHPTLAVAYFGAPGLPRTLTRVPLEYFARALALLRTRPGVDPQRLWVHGVSRGGEAALLLGATYPQLVHGVVAMVPGSYVNAAIPTRGASAWTLHGRDVPYAGVEKFGAPAAAVDPRAVIPVERIAGPVLLSCGELDLLWPSCDFVDDVTARLAAKGSRVPVTARKYPAAGHFATSGPPYASVTAAGLEPTGGTVAATGAATADFHARLLAALSG